MLYISHRGNYNSICENKISCLINTIKKSNVDGIETDVRKTKDNIFVLSHDSLFGQIEKRNYKNEPKLETLLENMNNKLLFLDLKCNKNYKEYFYYLNNLLNEFDLNIYLCSFNYELIKYIKENYPYKCGLIIGKSINIDKNYKIFDFVSVKSNSLLKNIDIPYFIWGKYIKTDDINCIGYILDNKKNP